MPVPGARQLPLPDPSDGFTTAELGLQWAFWHEFDPARFSTGQGVLNLRARGRSLTDSSALTTPVGGHSYTVEIDVEVAPGCSTGLLLFYDPGHATGILLDGDGIGVRLANGYVAGRYHKGATRATLRIVNDDQEVDFYFRLPGQSWQRTRESAEVSGMHHNVLGGFLDLRPAVFAAGSGSASFRNFCYWPEAKAPA
jgi:beta-xylosidase